MKLAVFIINHDVFSAAGVEEALDKLESAGVEIHHSVPGLGFEPGTGLVLSLGGDGTFLSAASAAHEAGLPVLGVNLGRMGFLAEFGLQEAVDAIISGNLPVSERSVLEVFKGGKALRGAAINEVSLLRLEPGTIGVDVTIDGSALPTYWADGVLVATSSGSTAYNLSIGGPICFPGSGVMVVSPIAPHNLGVRPLVVPQTSTVRLKLHCGDASLNRDNRTSRMCEGEEIEIRASREPLKVVSGSSYNYIDSLRSRFFWGQDVRNGK